MKLNINFLAFIILITSSITMPSLIEDNFVPTISFSFSYKSEPSEVTELKNRLTKFTIEEAQSDAKNNCKKGFLVYKTILNNLSDVKAMLENSSFILSTETENNLYNLYEKFYNKTKAEISNESSLTSQVNIASCLQTISTPNADVKKVEEVLYDLSNRDVKAAKSNLPYKLQYAKYLQSQKN